jgi:hypothetical protein
MYPGTRNFGLTAVQPWRHSCTVVQGGARKGAGELNRLAKKTLDRFAPYQEKNFTLLAKRLVRTAQ